MFDSNLVLNVIYFLYGGNIILLLSVPSLRGCFSLRAQNSSILQLLIPYALYRAEMIYKSWNAGKNFFYFLMLPENFCRAKYTSYHSD